MSNITKHYDAYSCLLAGIYNYFRIVKKLDFHFAHVGMRENFFEIDNWDHILGGQNPQTTVKSFLSAISASFKFQNLIDVDKALIHIRKTVDNQGIVAIGANPNYITVSDASHHDDYWNFQLVVDYKKNGGYTLFNMFHGKYYDIETKHFINMIDTNFNYRHKGEFTPCMDFTFDNYEKTCQIINNFNDREHLLTLVDSYNFEGNMGAVKKLTSQLESTHNNNVSIAEKEIYQLKDFLLSVKKSRLQFFSFVRHVLPTDIEILFEWEQLWSSLTNTIVIIIMRQKISEYQRLQEKLTELVYFEVEALQTIKKTVLQSNNKQKSAS